MKVFEPKVVIDDPALINIRREYKEYRLNGERREVTIRDPKSGVERIKVKESFIFQIPRDKPTAPSLLATQRPEAESPTVNVNPLAPTGGTSGSGRLRSVTP